MNYQGRIIPLVDRLYVDKAWELIYQDGKSVIFLKDTAENRDLLQKFALPRDLLHDEIIIECKQGIRDTPATWGYYETLGYMYMQKHRLKEARVMFEKYLSMNPDNQNIRRYLGMIKRHEELRGPNKGHP